MIEPFRKCAIGSEPDAVVVESNQLGLLVDANIGALEFEE